MKSKLHTLTSKELHKLFIEESKLFVKFLNDAIDTQQLLIIKNRIRQIRQHLNFKLEEEKN